MGVEKIILSQGDGKTVPKLNDQIAMEYTGWLHDPNAGSNDFKGSQFDSSEGRGDFKTAIGIGRVIKGWDQGILGTADSPGMTLGEKARLIITGDYAYGATGFPGLIPPNATLIFDVRLVGINNQRA